MVPESIGSRRLIARHSVDLPDPDGPEHHHDLAGCDLEVDVAQDVQLAEVLVDGRHPDHGRSRSCGASGHGGTLGRDRTPQSSTLRQPIGFRSYNDAIVLRREAGPVHILLVEDDDRIAAALRPALHRHGMTTTRLARGRGAVDHLAGVDVVLLDLGPARHRRRRRVPRDPRGQRGAGDRGVRARRGRRPDPGSALRRRRLPGQALRHRRARGAGARGVPAPACGRPPSTVRPTSWRSTT